MSVNNTSVGTIGPFGLGDDLTIRLLSFSVPVGLLTGVDVIKLTYLDKNQTNTDPTVFGGPDGFAINFSELDISTPVPEPSTMLLLGSGLLGLWGFRKKFKK